MSQPSAVRRVVFNRKGGVGKSTIVCNLAAMAAEAGRRALVVDLDPQGNATQYLLGEAASDAEPHLAEFFEQTLGFKLLRPSPEEWVHETRFENLSVMASHPDLGELQAKLESRFKIYKLKEVLEGLEDFDEVWIDTPPAVGFYTTSALIAAHRCLIPFDCDDFSRRALYQLMETVDEVRADHNPDLEIEGIVVNHFQARARLPRELVAELREEDLPVLEPYLTTSVKVKESHQAAAPLAEVAPRHKLTELFRELYASLRD